MTHPSADVHAPAAGELEEIRKRAEAATPANIWNADGWACVESEDGPAQPPMWAICGFGVGTYPIAYAYRQADGEFIAAARQDIPKLLAYIASLEGRVRTTESALRICEQYLSNIAGLGVPGTITAGAKKHVARMLNQSIAAARAALLRDEKEKAG